ncbi:MAG: glycosyltransferase family 87 protein [Pyrinomonadaceae bacterium]
MEIQSTRKWLVFVFLTLSCLWFSGFVQREINNYLQKAPVDYFDFHVYYVAGKVAGSDTDKRLYAYQEISDPGVPAKKIVVNPQLQSFEPDSTYGSFAKQENSDIGQYLYPPFFAMAMIPMTAIPYAKAQAVWHILVFLFACLAVIFTVRLFYEDYLTVGLTSAVIIFVLEFTHPMRDLLFVGNIGSLIILLTVAGIYLHKKYPSIGALLFALAVIIKLTPIAIVPLMIIRRQWKWLIAFCCWSVLLWGISIWFLGWQNHYEFVTRVIPAMSDGVAHRDNRSFSTGLSAIYSGKFMTIEEARAGENISPPRPPIILFKILTILSFGGLLFLFWFYNRTDSQINVEILILTLWSIIFSPVSFRHYYILSLAPFIYAWLHPFTKKASVFHLTWLSVATLMIFSILPNYGYTITESFPVHLALFFVMPLGVVLCIWYLMNLLKTQPVDYRLELEK